MDDERKAKALVERIAHTLASREQMERDNNVAVQRAFVPIADWIDTLRREVKTGGKQWTVGLSSWQKAFDGAIAASIIFSKPEIREDSISVRALSSSEFEIAGKNYRLPGDLDHAKQAIGEMVFEFFTM